MNTLAMELEKSGKTTQFHIIMLREVGLADKSLEVTWGCLQSESATFGRDDWSLRLSNGFHFCPVHQLDFIVWFVLKSSAYYLATSWRNLCELIEKDAHCEQVFKIWGRRMQEGITGTNELIRPVSHVTLTKARRGSWIWIFSPFS